MKEMERRFRVTAYIDVWVPTNDVRDMAEDRQAAIDMVRKMIRPIPNSFVGNAFDWPGPIGYREKVSP
jgi:hypothetical protein